MHWKSGGKVQLQKKARGLHQALFTLDWGFRNNPAYSRKMGKNLRKQFLGA